MELKTKADVVTLLHEYELRVTPHRVAILMLLAKKKVPVAVHALYEALHKERMDQATLYRTLGTLGAANLVTRISGTSGEALYTLASDEDTYVLLCSSCGISEKKESPDLLLLSKKILRKSTKFQGTAPFSLSLLSLCKKCA